MKKKIIIIVAVVVCVFAVLAVAFFRKNGTSPTDQTDTTITDSGDETLVQPDESTLKNNPRLSSNLSDFVPRDDYEAIYPYLGHTTSDIYGEHGFFGLCRGDGTIIVDDIYTEVNYNDGYYLLLKSYAPRPPEGDSLFGIYYLISADGKTVHSFPENSNVTYLGEGIYVCSTLTVIDNYWNIKNTWYNSSCEILLEDEENEINITAFHNGIALMTDTRTYSRVLTFVDKNLNTVSTVSDATVIDEKNGVCSVRESNGKYAFYVDGKKKTEAVYDNVQSSDYNDGFTVMRDGKAYILDSSFKTVAEFEVDEDTLFAEAIGPDYIKAYLSEWSYIVVGRDGSEFDTGEIGYLKNLNLYYKRGSSFDYSDDYPYVVFSPDGTEVYTTPEGVYLEQYISTGDRIVLTRTTKSGDDYVTAYDLYDPTTKETTSDVRIFYYMGDVTVGIPTSDGVYYELVNPKGMKHILKTVSFYLTCPSALGTLTFYDTPQKYVTLNPDFSPVGVTSKAEPIG